MASKNALLMLRLLAMIVLISSKATARSIFDTSSNSKSVEDAKKIIDQSEIGSGISDVANVVDIHGKDNTIYESKINPGLDGLEGVTHLNGCNHVCCNLPNEKCVCC